MLNNNHKNSICNFAESLVTYLYNEIGDAEKQAFEAHLDSCASCNEELKEFGFARSAVQQWRAVDFDSLHTPIFEISTQTIQSISAISESKKSSGWFDGWKKFLSFKPAMAMSALVILIALFTIAAFVFNFKTDKPIAESIKEKELVKTAVSPTIERKIEEKKEIVIPKNPETPNSLTINPPVNNDERKTLTVKPVVTKVSTVTSKNGANKIALPDDKRNPKSDNQPKSGAPQLTDAEEEEDDSVRLADLFDEIGTE